MRKESRRPVVQCLGSNGVSFGLYALSFGGWSKQWVVWRLKRTVVRVHAKRRVVWRSVIALSSVCTRRPVVRSRDQTACRPCEADARSFGLTETAPFRLNEMTPFWTPEPSPTFVSFFFLVFFLHFCFNRTTLSLSLVRPPLRPLSLPRRPEDSLEVTSSFSLLF